MKTTLTVNRLIAAVVSVLAYGAFGGAAFAGDLPRSDAPLSLAIDTPAGTLSRLTHVPGEGWALSERTDAPHHNREAGQAGPVKPLPAGTSPSVFVDGPTGYVFVYVLDEGWKFVGRVADQR